MSRVVIVRPDSSVVEDATTVRLHTYPSGEILVRTDARSAESDVGQEEAVETGLRLGPLWDHPDGRVGAGGNARAARAEEPGAPWPAVAEGVPGSGYVEMIGPLDPSWTQALREAGLRILKHVPNHTFLCRGEAAAFAAAGALPFVAKVTPLTAELKKGMRLTETVSQVWIIAFKEEDSATLTGQLDALPGVELAADASVETADIYFRIKAKIDAEGQEHLRAHPAVFAIEPFSPRLPEDEVACLVLAGQYDSIGRASGSYLSWLDEQGLDGSGVSIGVADSGVQTDHQAFGNRARGGIGNGVGWHGTFVAGHAAGSLLSDKDNAGFIYGLGMAPAARIIAQDNNRSANDLCRETLDEIGQDGVYAVVQNNSWGSGLKDPMDYGSLEAQYDSMVRNASATSGASRPLAVFFSSGNSGSKGLTRPKAAKNIIVTGNSEIYRPTVGKEESDNINDVFAGEHASSWGNCGDGRVRPDVVAPGEWTASAGYDVHPGDVEYINERLTWGGGSSGASPKTCGGAALLTQWWRNHAGETPSPAMLRALIVNGAVDMDPAGGIPGRKQGWGRLNLGNVLDDSVHHTYLDQKVFLRTRGEEAAWTFQVSDPSRPVRVTLCWTDPPGAVGSGTASAPALVNRLALRIDVGDRRFLGNAFRAGWSDDGLPGHREGMDNLQNVYVRAGAVDGTFRVAIAALDVTTDCLTNMPGDPQQDFALVVTNGHLDEGATPAEVFLVVDGKSVEPGEAALREDGAATPGDTSVINSPVLNATDRDGTGGVGSGKMQGGETEADWWAEDGIQWSVPETDRPDAGDAAKAEAARAALGRGCAAAADLVAAAGGGLSVGGSAQETVRTLANGNVDEARRAAVAAAARPLSDQLGAAAAMALRGPGADLANMRRAAFVVAVGPRSRLDPEDLAALRRLAFLANLTVVSHDSLTLEWLAQRVHRRTGVRYRLASSAEDLGRALRDGVGEALGCQAFAVKKAPDGADGAKATRFSFLVVSGDRRLYIRIRHPGGGSMQEIRLFRPGEQKGYTVGAKTQRMGHKVRIEPGAAHIEIDAPSDRHAWAGEWQIAVTMPDEAPSSDATAAVWGWSTHKVRTALIEAPASESAKGEAGFVLSVGGNGSKIARCSISIMPKPMRGEEKERDLRPVPRKLSRIALEEEAGRRPDLDAGASSQSSTGSGTLSTVLRAKAPRAGAVLQDIAVSAMGATSAGESFARLLRLNILRLEPRPSWRRRLARFGRPHLIQAEVVDVKRDDAGIVALRLRHGNRIKGVSVDTPDLGRTLARLDLARPGMRFGVAGKCLISVVVNVEPPGSEEAYGIEDSIPDVEARAPEAEQLPDYPLASRYIQARHFRSPTSPRAVRRVVIHITDGGRNIEGPISWFRNPVKEDGTPVPVSAHYIVGLNGEVVQMVRHEDVAYHAGSANGDSIGIEHCARPERPGRPGIAPTAVQYAASAALVRWICEENGIPMDRDHVLGHSEAASTSHTGCPNSVWNWDYYMKMVIEGMSLPP